MRAIRTVVAARTIVGDDPALAYTLLVAALEAVAQLAIPAESLLDWERYDPSKRSELDPVLATLEPPAAEAMRSAILRADQRSLGRRFKSFIFDHVEPSYYRSEANGVARPVRACDLAHALDVAYRLRSRHVHELRHLEPELWVIADRADTLPWEGKPRISHLCTPCPPVSLMGSEPTDHAAGTARGFVPASSRPTLFMDFISRLGVSGRRLFADVAPVTPVALPWLPRFTPSRDSGGPRRPRHPRQRTAGQSAGRSINDPARWSGRFGGVLLLRCRHAAPSSRSTRRWRTGSSPGGPT